MKHFSMATMVFYLFLFISCGPVQDFRTYQNLKEACKEACELFEDKGIKKVIRLRELTDFEWDKCWILYGPKPGFVFKNTGIEEYYLYIPDDHTRFIFLKNQKVVAFFDLPTKEGYIKPDGEISYTASEDSFYVSGSRSDEWINGSRPFNYYVLYFFSKE